MNGEPLGHHVENILLCVQATLAKFPSRRQAVQGGSDKSLLLGCDLSLSGSAASILTVKLSGLPTVALFFVAPPIKDGLQQCVEGCDGRLVQV